MRHCRRLVGHDVVEERVGRASEIPEINRVHINSCPFVSFHMIPYNITRLKMLYLWGMGILDIELENSGLPFDDQSSIIVPDTACPLTDGQMTALRNAVNPRAASQSFGCDTYIAAVQFCEQFLGQ